MIDSPDLNAGQLVPSIHVETLLAHRAKVLETMRQACALLVEADRLAVSAGFGSLWQRVAEHIERTRYARFSAHEPGSTDSTVDPAPELMERYEKDLDAAGWDHLLKASGLRTFMDSEAREQWSESIQKREAPTLNADNIAATFQALHGARADMVERGVLQVFRRLSWDYKTNQPSLFGKRLIVSSVRSYYRTSTDQLDDLVRAFCIYDGKPEPDHRAGLASLITSAANEGKRDCENEYLHLRWFKNGNGHVTFKRPDLVDTLNAVLSKHHPNALPAARR